MGRGKRPVSMTVIAVVLIAIGSIVLLFAVSVSGDIIGPIASEFFAHRDSET